MANVPKNLWDFGNVGKEGFARSLLLCLYLCEFTQDSSLRYESELLPWGGGKLYMIYAAWILGDIFSRWFYGRGGI